MDFIELTDGSLVPLHRIARLKPGTNEHGVDYYAVKDEDGYTIGIAWSSQMEEKGEVIPCPSHLEVYEYWDEDGEDGRQGISYRRASVLGLRVQGNGFVHPVFMDEPAEHWFVWDEIAEFAFDNTYVTSGSVSEMVRRLCEKARMAWERRQKIKAVQGEG